MGHYLVLAIHAALNLVTLNKCDYFPLDFLDGPTKCQCHTVETNRFERLEVEYDGCVSQMLSDIVHMDTQVYVYVVSCLSKQFQPLSI